ncbi:hypothetical protein D3C72_1923770 [compost metagenome]
MLVLFIISFIGLGILGALPSTNVRTLVAQIFSVVYFAFFLAMPFYTKNDVGSTPVPTRVTMSTPARQVRFAVLVVVTLVAATLFAKFI